MSAWTRFWNAHDRRWIVIYAHGQHTTPLTWAEAEGLYAVFKSGPDSVVYITEIVTSRDCPVGEVNALSGPESSPKCKCEHRLEHHVEGEVDTGCMACLCSEFRPESPPAVQEKT